MGGSSSNNITNTNIALKATMDLVNDISLDVSQQFSSDTNGSQANKTKQENIYEMDIAGENIEVSGNKVNQLNDAKVTLKMIMNIKASLAANADIQQVQAAIQDAAMKSMSEQNSKAAADLGTLSQQLNKDNTNIDMDMSQKLKNTVSETFAQKVAETVNSTQESDLEQLNKGKISLTGAGLKYKSNDLYQANKAVVELTEEIAKDILAELGTAVGQSQRGEQKGDVTTQNSQKGESEAKGLGSLLNGLVIGIVFIVIVVIAGVAYMLSSMLKNPEGVTAIGNVATDVTKASMGMPTGGDMSKASKINTMVIIAYILMIMFVILAVLTVIFFFKWMALKNPLIGIFKTLIAKVNKKAGDKIDEKIKKNKIGFIVCLCIGGACMISNFALTTFIKQGKAELAVGMRGGRRHRHH